MKPNSHTHANICMLNKMNSGGVYVLLSYCCI